MSARQGVKQGIRSRPRLRLRPNPRDRDQNHNFGRETSLTKIPVYTEPERFPN